MAGPPAETRLSVRCETVRAQHFAWREAVRQMCPDVDPAQVADRPGCDILFQKTTEGLAEALGVPLHVETLATLPDGDDACVRRFRVETA